MLTVDKINNRYLCIMGCGVEGAKLYYCLNRQGIPIKYCFDSEKTGSFFGHKIYRFAEKEAERDSLFVLLASEKYYKEMKNTMGG